MYIFKRIIYFIIHDPGVGINQYLRDFNYDQVIYESNKRWVLIIGQFNWRKPE
jgi:hypothetical protein